MDSKVTPAQVEDELASFRGEKSIRQETPLSVRLATEHIHGHLFDPELTVKRLRKQLGLTDAMFSTRFRHHHGCSPACYIRRLRVEAAKRLFRHFDDLPAAAVALYVGYEHYRTFARVFKRVTDQSPQAFREEDESA